MNGDLNDRLKAINDEDFIWLIYLGIIIYSWYSNKLERDYLISNNVISKEKYRKSLIIIFSILVVVYLYFLKSSIKDVNNLKETDSFRKKKLVKLSFVGSLLIAISGFIFLYIAFMDENLDVEIAFN